MGGPKSLVEAGCPYFAIVTVLKLFHNFHQDLLIGKPDIHHFAVDDKTGFVFDNKHTVAKFDRMVADGTMRVAYSNEQDTIYEVLQ